MGADVFAAVAVLFAAATLLYMAWPTRPRTAAAVRATTVYKVTTIGPRPRPSDPTVILRHRRGGRHV